MIIWKFMLLVLVQIIQLGRNCRRNIFGGFKLITRIFKLWQVTKLIGASLTDNTIDATQLDETGKHAFTKTVLVPEKIIPMFYGELSTA